VDVDWFFMWRFAARVGAAQEMEQGGSIKCPTCLVSLRPIQKAGRWVALNLPTFAGGLKACSDHAQAPARWKVRMNRKAAQDCVDKLQVPSQSSSDHRQSKRTISVQSRGES